MANELPAHIRRMQSNMTDAMTLMEIHEKLTGKGPGFRHRVEILNRSGLVLLVACWEAFVEDLARHAFQILLQNAKKPSAIPKKVQVEALKILDVNEDASKSWQLAGDGWRTVLAKHQTEVLRPIDKQRQGALREADRFAQPATALALAGNERRARGFET